MITFEPIKKNKTALLNIIIDKANSLIESKTLTIFYLHLQSFIDSLKLTNYQLQPKDIIVLDRLPNPDRIEFFKRDSEGNLVYLTTFREVKIETLQCVCCASFAEQLENEKANGFFDNDLNCFVHDNRICKGYFYKFKQASEFGLTYSEVIINQSNVEIITNKIFKKENKQGGFKTIRELNPEIFGLPNSNNGTTTPKLESKKNSDHTAPEKLVTLSEALRPEKYYTLTSEEILTSFPKLLPFIESGKANDVIRVWSQTLDKCGCTFCNKFIEKGKNDDYELLIKHNNSELFYVYCNDCVNELGFPLFELPTEETPKTDVLAEVQYLYLSVNEKIALINKARWPHVEKEITWDDFTKVETHLFYPFYVFENFHASEKLLYCDCCRELFEGNGSYATAFFVFHSADDLKIYCSKSEFDYHNTIEYLDMLHGYKKPIQLTHKYIGSIEHELIFSLIGKGKRYLLNNYVPNGFKTIAELKPIIDFGFGGGSSLKEGWLEHKSLKIEYFTKSNKFSRKNPDLTIKPNETLQIINEILADNKPQAKITKTNNAKNNDIKPIEKTPNIELKTNQNLGNFWDFLNTKPSIAIIEHKLNWNSIETQIIAKAKDLFYCDSLTIFQNNLKNEINNLKQSNHVKASHVYQLEIIGNELILFHNSLSKIDKTKVASFKMINNAKNNDVKPIEKTPIIEPTTPILELKPKKQIAIKPSELPSIKAMRKNNSKSINDTYAGGKNASGVYQFLINHVPPVKCIVSGFLGHCGLIKNIKPAKMMVGIDKDILVTDRWNKENLGVTLITGDFLNNLDWVNPAKFGETLVFLDPPYLDETRSSQGKLYNYEFQTTEQHKTLLEKAIKFPCYVMITAYENTLYNAYLDGRNGFTKHYFNGQTRAGRKQECMYINYEVPTQLHDYKYYGEDYRTRWNNKKLIDRTISQLKDMPPLRRNMVIDAILNQQF